MEDIENKKKKEAEEVLYSKEDFEAYKEELQNEFLKKEETMRQELESEAKKAGMTELERTQAELAEIKQKYEEKEKECLISKEKEETKAILEEEGLQEAALELVYMPLDMEKTKSKIGVLKNYIGQMKKDILQNYINTPLPLTSNQAAYDAFIEGFDTNSF